MPGNNALRIRLQAGGRCASEKGNDALEGGKGKPPLLSLACLQGDRSANSAHEQVCGHLVSASSCTQCWDNGQ